MAWTKAEHRHQFRVVRRLGEVGFDNLAEWQQRRAPQRRFAPRPRAISPSYHALGESVAIQDRRRAADADVVNLS